MSQLPQKPDGSLSIVSGAMILRSGETQEEYEERLQRQRDRQAKLTQSRATASATPRSRREIQPLKRTRGEWSVGR